MNIVEMLSEKTRLESEIENINDSLNSKVRRVLKIFNTVVFENNPTEYYSSKSATYALFGNHLWSQYYTDFEIDDGILIAGGMYSGSKSYYEHETIRFPVEWIDMNDEELSCAMQKYWQEELEHRAAKEKIAKAEHVEKLRVEYESLKAEIETE